MPGDKLILFPQVFVYTAQSVRIDADTQARSYEEDSHTLLITHQAAFYSISTSKQNESAHLGMNKCQIEKTEN